ncbi:MAG: AraC family transcriptional regulator [Proteobacteria bacterium]|nr:AraC family transcriptional regulator [Pseudomonadota bacterium]
MSPCLELVGIQEQDSFKVWTHGYPYETVRWHFHPEYELNLITDTCGRYFVGDHTGRFEPGQLCMMGPNLPHNWISEVPDNRPVAQRCIVLQFSGRSINRGIAAFPELAHIERLLASSQRGILFSAAVARRAGAVMNQLLNARGFQRVHQFLALLDMLATAQDSTLLATPAFRPDPEGYQSSTINQVLTYLAERLGDRLREADVARYAGMEPSAFSRFFRRHTDVPFVQYLGRLRVNRACELLINSDKPITEICYACGFNNVSNFNRQFLALKGMPPSQFRRYHRLNDLCAVAA